MWVRGNNPELDATKTPTAIDIAWAAGVYEGEGHCRLYGSNASKQRGFSLAVTQKDPEILYRLRDWFGGSVKFAKCATIPAEQQCYRWDCCGNRARVFIALVFGFLSARRKAQVEQAQALAFLGGESPVGMSMETLKDRMLAYYEADKQNKWRSPEFWRTEEFRKYNREKQREYRARKRNASDKVISIA